MHQTDRVRATPVLRPARPTESEGLVFARHLDTAADGIFGLLLGRRAPEIIARAYAVPGHDLSYEFVTVAEIDGAIAGMASAYSGVDHATSNERVLVKAAGPLRTARMSMIALAMLPFARFINRVPAEDHYLQAVAVDDEWRGHGVGSLLIDHVEETARRAGSTRLALDVATDNRDAQRLYERLGMTVEATSPRTFLIAGPAVRRMTKPL